MAVSAVSTDSTQVDELRQSMFDKFIIDPSLSVRSFLKVWHTCKFTRVYANKSGRELIDLVGQLLQTSVEGLSKCNGIERRIFSLYLAASIFFTQPVTYKMPIRITLAHFDDLIDLTTQAEQVKDVLAIVQGLKSKNALCLVHSYQTYGPKVKSSSKTANTDHQLSQDRFNCLKSSLKELVDKVSAGHEEYEKMKVDKKIDILDPAANQVGSFLEQIELIKPTKIQPKSETDPDDIGLRRRNLKNKSKTQK